tara:strand:+ start:370 stop:681 length:312 start_codon:yes stop_codon:yes gene_type:complete
MSYITLTKQYKENLITKAITYIKDELRGMEIEFDRMFKVDIETQKGPEEWIVVGISEEGMVTGRNDMGDDVEFDLNGIDVETLSYMMDQLLEVNYKSMDYEVR